MTDKGYLPKDKWEPFIESLSNDFRVYAPCEDDGVVTFQVFEKGKKIDLSRPSTSAPKGVMFPQSDTLFAYKFKKEPETPEKTAVELDASTNIPETVIVGARPCDAKGFITYDRVYLEVDPYYAERREKTTVVGLCCGGPFAGCFCTSTGGGLAEKEGSDVFVTELDNGYFLEALTEKGKKILGRPGIEDGASYADAAAKKQEAASKALPRVIPGDGEPRLSREAFESDEFWDRVSAKCLSCGACTYLCPTCYCFNITDEARLEGGERVRSWDACMFHHFTLEASGHNPRGRKAQRLKQRVGHKFLYYVDKYGTIACSGCGRCIRHCPVSVEISGIVASLAEGAQTEQKAAEARS